MDLFHHIVYGATILVTGNNLIYLFVGCLLGTLVGVLPGLGPPAALSILLPLTYEMSPASSLIMLSGIYYGAMYGGSTTSILVNIPGEAASVVTCFDGYKMALAGRAGPALGISAIGSFVAGTFGTAMIMLLAPLMVSVALKFGPSEFVGLLVLSLTMVAFLSSISPLKALITANIGLILGTVGTDPIKGVSRFVYGIPTLMDGVGLIPLVMGLFGISEVLINLEGEIKREILASKIKGLWPNRRDLRVCAGPIARGSVLGFFMGILPGMGAIVPTFVSYTIEKKLSRHPDQFGKGAIEGVAAPEAANNAASSGCFVPLLTLGIPTNVIMALLIGALVVQGVEPGPLLLTKHPDIFWGVIMSMYLGNIVLVVLNLPLIGMWVKILKVPYHILYPLIILFCIIGAYSVSGNPDDIIVLTIFGGLGYVMRKTEFDTAPLVLGFILGPMFEEAFRQTLILSNGKFRIFYDRPISFCFLLLVGLLLVFTPLKNLFKKIHARIGPET